MSAKLFFSLLLLLGLLASCSSQGGRAAWTEEDEWYTGSPQGEEPYWSWPKVDSSQIHEVVESQHPEAEALLQDVSILELAPEQATRFIDKPLPDVPGTKPYLVRGLYLNRGTGRFMVYTSGDQLAVHHGSLGKRAVPMKRQALVLQLEQGPKEVFVFCSMAE